MLLKWTPVAAKSKIVLQVRKREFSNLFPFVRFDMRSPKLALLGLMVLTSSALAQEKPNIVFIFMDNFGYGELGIYGGGITRGGATPRIDALAAEGIRLTNFNVEVQCTPSREIGRAHV